MLCDFVAAKISISSDFSRPWSPGSVLNNPYIHRCPAFEFSVGLPVIKASSRMRNIGNLSESLHVMLLWVPWPRNRGTVAVFRPICRP